MGPALVVLLLTFVLLVAFNAAVFLRNDRENEGRRDRSRIEALT